MTVVPAAGVIAGGRHGARGFLTERHDSGPLRDMLVRKAALPEPGGAYSSVLRPSFTSAARRPAGGLAGSWITARRCGCSARAVGLLADDGGVCLHHERRGSKGRGFARNLSSRPRAHPRAGTQALRLVPTEKGTKEATKKKKKKESSDTSSCAKLRVTDVTQRDGVRHWLASGRGGRLCGPKSVLGLPISHLYSLPLRRARSNHRHSHHCGTFSDAFAARRSSEKPWSAGHRRHSRPGIAV